MDKLNKAQAEALFAEKAILIGTRDAIPEETVVELFGEAAVAHAHTLDGQNWKLCSLYGIGEYQQRYLTLNGFLTACTYNNVHALELESQRKEKEERELIEGWDAFTQDDYNGLVYSLYLQWVDDLGGKTAADKEEARRVQARFAELEGIDRESPAALAYSFFWAGVGKGIEAFTKITGAGD